MQAAIRHDDTREHAADAEIVHCNAVHADSSTYTCLLGFAGNGNMASSIPLIPQHMHLVLVLDLNECLVDSGLVSTLHQCLAPSAKALAFALTSLLLRDALQNIIEPIDPC
jgi:hypothetical protein